MAEHDDSRNDQLCSIDEQILELINQRIAVSEKTALKNQVDDAADMNLLAEEEKSLLHLCRKNSGPPSFCSNNRSSVTRKSPMSWKPMKAPSRRGFSGRDNS